MTDKILYWTTGFFAALALLLSIADMALVRGNQNLQTEVNQRASVITTAQRVAPLNQQLSQAIYDVSMKENEPKLRELLVAQGFVLPGKKAEEAAKPAPEMKKEEPKKEAGHMAKDKEQAKEEE